MPDNAHYRHRIEALKDKIERRNRSIEIRNEKIRRLEERIKQLQELHNASAGEPMVQLPTLTRQQDQQGREWFGVVGKRGRR